MIGIGLRTGGGISFAMRLWMRGMAASRSRSRDGVAELVVVALEPARPDAQDQPAVRDVVDGARHVGEELRVAVAVARDERADLDPLGRLGHRAEPRPALEVVAVAIARERVEVIPGEHGVRTELLGPQPGVAHRPRRPVLRLHLHPHPDPACVRHGPET
jgi:hypothetical protein